MSEHPEAEWVGDEKSYYSDAVTTRDDLSEFFAAASSFWDTVSAGDVFDEGALIQVTIGALDVSEATVSLLGEKTQYGGFMLFSNIDEYHAMRDGTDAEGHRVGSFSATILTFRAASDVPEAMRDEVEQEGWERSASKLYPVVRRMADGIPASVRHADLQAVTAIARALTPFLATDREALDEYGEHEVERSYLDAHGVTTTLTVPHPDVDLADFEAPPRAQTYDGIADPYELPLSTQELAKLQAALPTMSLHRLIGTFTAIAITPRMVRPQIWLSMILSVLRANSAAEREQLVELLMRTHGDVMDRAEALLFEGLIPDANAIVPCREWATGFSSLCDAADLSDDDDDDTLQRLFSFHVLAEDPEAMATVEAQRGDESVESVLTQLREDLVDTVAGLYEHWEASRAREVEELQTQPKMKQQPVVRASPKTGRNDPCPCGSGKKYKKCHG